MKTSLKNQFIAGVASVAAVLAVSQAWTAPVQPAAAEHVVVVSAKRMTTEQKIAFDTEGQAVQQVIISARRMNAQEQIAFDTAGQSPQQVVVSAHKMSAQEKLAYDQARQAEIAQAYRSNDPS